MKTILLALSLLIGAAAAALAQGCPGGYGAPPPPNPAPDAFLYGIYAHYTGAPEQTKPIDYSKEAELGKYFTPEIVAIIMKDRAAADARGEVPTLDGDPFVGAQEWNIAGFDIKVDSVAGDSAMATVKFRNYDRDQTFHLKLRRVGNAWRIDDVDYGGDAGTLRGMFAQNP
jgi:hypothetical protein